MHLQIKNKLYIGFGLLSISVALLWIFSSLNIFRLTISSDAMIKDNYRIFLSVIGRSIGVGEMHPERHAVEYIAFPFTRVPSHPHGTDPLGDHAICWFVGVSHGPLCRAGVIRIHRNRRNDDALPIDALQAEQGQDKEHSRNCLCKNFHDNKLKIGVRTFF